MSDSVWPIEIEENNCMSQETQTGTLYHHGVVVRGGRWEGDSKGRGYTYSYGWFMLRFQRKQQNFVRQLSFNLNINKFKKQIEIEENNIMWETRDLFRNIRDIKGIFHAKK